MSTSRSESIERDVGRQVIAGRAGDLRYRRRAGASQAVEERALAGVGGAGQNDLRQGGGCIRLARSRRSSTTSAPTRGGRRARRVRRIQSPRRRNQGRLRDRPAGRADRRGAARSATTARRPTGRARSAALRSSRASITPSSNRLGLREIDPPGEKGPEPLIPGWAGCTPRAKNSERMASRIGGEETACTSASGCPV